MREEQKRVYEFMGLWEGRTKTSLWVYGREERKRKVIFKERKVYGREE